MASGLIEFIHDVFVFLMKLVQFILELVLDVVCTFLVAIALLDIIRILDIFHDLSLVGSRWQYRSVAALSALIAVLDFFTFFPMVLVTCSWRACHTWKKVADAHTSRASSGGDVTFTAEARGQLWLGAGNVLVDIPCIIAMVLCVFAFWRIPFLITALCKDEDKRSVHWRLLGFCHLLVGFVDVLLLVPFLVLTFSHKSCSAFDKIRKEYSSHKGDSEYAVWYSTPRMIVFGCAAEVVLDYFVLLSFIPCIFLPWRYYWIYSACRECGKEGHTPTPEDWCLREHQVHWRWLGIINSAFGLFRHRHFISRRLFAAFLAQRAAGCGCVGSAHQIHVQRAGRDAVQRRGQNDRVGALC